MLSTLQPSGQAAEDLRAALKMAVMQDKPWFGPVTAEEAVEAILAAIARQGLSLVSITTMREAGWLICPPGHLPMPRSCTEAGFMHVLAERYLSDHRGAAQFVPPGAG